ncbi:MAG: TolC family protein, partial [Rhizobacter sp.]
HTRPLVATAAAVLLAGCASFSPDGGFGTVGEMTKARTGQTPAYQRTTQDSDAAQQRVAELLRQPLTPDSAVEVALLNNRGLQARFGELGIRDADRVRAGRLRNPSFAFGRLSGGGNVEIDRAVLFDVLGLLTLPATARFEREGFEQTQLQAAADAVGVATEARRAFFSAVAAQELVRYFGQVQDAADASSELAQRMLAAGNFSKLAQMREQAFHADATAQLARAKQQAVAERERLTRWLGLSGAQLGFTLPERLPDLPAEPLAPQNAEQTAMDTRLDVLMAKRSAASAAQSLGLTRATRVVNVLNAGYQNKSQTDAPRQNGYVVELELPLFDFGTTRVARAEAVYLQAVQHAADVGLNAQSEVRESYAAYLGTYTLVRHYRDELVPLRKRISDENLLRYNGMLISVFELLADAREQVISVTGYVEALRDHWIAQTHLQAALAGATPTEIRP